ncbi:MAG: 2TM domain-containing protein [Pseudomonadota bacterium]|nr:2TM domain-containing protein [Pseudomonadota bacterium]
MTRYSSGTDTFPTRFLFRGHALLFMISNTALLGGKLIFDTDWPLFWLLFGWGLVVAIHYFIAGAFDIDEDWANDKILEVKGRSYDFDHIRNIEQRVVERDPSVTHPVERND